MSLHPSRFWYEADGERIDFGFYGGFPIDWPTGVDGLSASVSTVSGAGGIGTEIQTANIPERIMMFNGYLSEPYPEEDRRRLRRMFALMKSGRLYAETTEHEVFYLDCFASAEPTIEGKRRFPRFLVQITAGYPYWQGVAEKKLSLKLTGSAATAAVNVETDVDAVYSVLFSSSGGSCVNLALAEDGTGLALRYNGTIDADETLMITISEFGRVSAKIGSRNVIGLVDCDLKKLPAGTRNFTLTAESNSGTITAEITYKEARAGV